MNTLIANQYGRVQGEAGGCRLTLCVTARTPRQESVELQTRIDAIEQQLHLPSKTKIYGRFSQFLVYEQVGQGRRIGNRVRPWLTCGCSIRTTVAPNRDWFFRQRSCANWEYLTRSSRRPQNLIRRDSFYSTTCRIRRSQQPAMPTKPQLTNPQLEPGGASCPKRRILAT
jgi:hypothetical protein